MGGELPNSSKELKIGVAKIEKYIEMSKRLYRQKSGFLQGGLKGFSACTAGLSSYSKPGPVVIRFASPGNTNEHRLLVQTLQLSARTFAA
jgi:hypothetical protein